jgi:predicted nucleotidyltransferase component of viral defense system
MGKVTLTPTQEQILTIIADEPYFSKTFYMTGGTALSAFYYHHRESEDIDLFTQQPFDQTFVQSWMTKQQKIHNWKLTYTQVFERQTYEISWKDHVGKIDFVRYDFRRLSPSTIQYKNIAVDSLPDIAVNKLLSISQRTAVKDYVDLYFLLPKDFTWWDLMGSVEKKFGIEIEKVYLSSLLLKVDQFDALPIMTKKLSLETLKKFFLSEAKNLAMTMVKA